MRCRKRYFCATSYLIHVTRADHFDQIWMHNFFCNVISSRVVRRHSLKFSWSQLQNMWICVTSVVNFNQRCHRISWSSNYSTTERSQSYTSDEMEFFNGIFSRGFWAYTRVFQDSSFFLVFYHHFSILQNTVHGHIRVLLKCFADIFVLIFKTRDWKAWSKILESFVNLMSKNSLSGHDEMPSSRPCKQNF